MMGSGCLKLCLSLFFAEAPGHIVLAGMVTYKRRLGQTLKSALLDKWRHSRGNPIVKINKAGILETTFFIEISRLTRALNRNAGTKIYNARLLQFDSSRSANTR